MKNIEQQFPSKPLSDRGKLILQAAQKLFLSHGYENTSLEMIITESGGSRRNIYSEFGNKEGLLKAVMQEQVRQQVGTLTSIDYTLPPAEALQKVCVPFVSGFLSETLLGLFRLMVNIVPQHPEIGELIYNYGPLTGCQPLSDYLASLNEQGILAIDDTQFAAKLLIEMVKGRLHIRALLLPEHTIPEQDVEDHVAKTIEIFLRAYRP
ncbi:TetR/AcrR family transcriptional regulator [Thalassotalea fusca]